jgi:hypothetical protein
MEIRMLNIEGKENFSMRNSLFDIEDYPAASCGECARYCGSKKGWVGANDFWLFAFEQSLIRRQDNGHFKTI